MSRWFVCSVAVYFLIVPVLLVTAQNVLQGRVEDGSSSKPVPFASLFLSNTTKGGLSNDAGVFVINNVPNGQYDLIVSCVGYETLKITVDTKAKTRYRIVLKPSENQLLEFKVVSKKSKKWFRDLLFFKANFLGRTENAANCVIKNENVLLFNDSATVFRAYAKDLIEIENKSLGYTIKYALVKFEYDRVKTKISFEGYPLFEPLVAESSDQAERWEGARKTTYLGSTRHFMSSLYTCSLETNGFVVNRIEEKIDKSGRPRLIVRHGEETNFYPTPADTVLRIISPDTLTCQQLTRKIPGDDTRVKFVSKKPVQVTYKREYESRSYQQFNAPPEYGYKKTPQVSIVYLTSPSITVESDGHFYNSADIVFELYWSWELVADLLPFDYEYTGHD